MCKVTIRLWRGISTAPSGNVGEYFTSDRNVAEFYFSSDDDDDDECDESNGTLFYVDVSVEDALTWKVEGRGKDEYHLPVNVANTAKVWRD
jgi:hypothetical protein